MENNRHFIWFTFSFIKIQTFFIYSMFLINWIVVFLMGSAWELDVLNSCLTCRHSRCEWSILLMWWLVWYEFDFVYVHTSMIGSKSWMYFGGFCEMALSSRLDWEWYLFWRWLFSSPRSIKYPYAKSRFHLFSCSAFSQFLFFLWLTQL